MVGLLLNDLYSMKRSVRTYSIFLLFFAVMGIISGNVSAFASFLAVYSMMFGISIFSYHEVCNWGAYVNTLPVHRGQIVRTYYLIAGISLLFGAIVGTLMNLVIVIAGQASLLESMAVMAVLMGIGMLMMAVYIPILLKWGSNRGRLIMMGSYVAVFVGIIGIAKLIGGRISVGALVALTNLTEQHILMLIGLALIAAMAAAVISYQISLRIYTKKEF